MKKGNTGIIFLLILLFIVTIALAIGIWYDRVSESIKHNDNQIQNILNEHKVTNDKSYKLGDNITLKDGSNWTVLADSPSSQDYVTVLGSVDYVDSILKSEWDKVFEQMYHNFVEYKDSDLDKFMQSQTSKIAANLKEVEGYSIRLITLEELLKLDNNFKYNEETGDYDYTGSSTPEYPAGITTMTSIKGEVEGKKWAYYTTGQTTCHEQQPDCTVEYFITTYKSGLGGFYPVVNIYKNSI